MRLCCQLISSPILNFNTDVECSEQFWNSVSHLEENLIETSAQGRNKNTKCARRELLGMGKEKSMPIYLQFPPHEVLLSNWKMYT